MPISLRTDRALLRADAPNTRHLLVTIVAPTAPRRVGRLPANVGLVLDRSGSMAGARKIDLAREAVERSLDLLRPDDRFTLVVYDDRVDVLVGATRASAEAKGLALGLLRDVDARGSTDLHAGWTAGAGQLAAALDPASVARVLLLTDGLANQGVTDPPSLAATAAALRARGIATSTFGVGADFDERLLRDVAHEGGGNFYFIEMPQQIPDLLTSELGEALEVVARGAALEVVLPPGVQASLLGRYRHTSAPDGTLRVELGDLVSGQELHVVVKLRFAPGRAGATTDVAVRLADRDAALGRAESRRTWEYATPEACNAERRDVVVDREAANLYAARARAEATEANREGDLHRARMVLERTADRIRGYAGGDPELEALWRALRDDVHRYAEVSMDAMQLKMAFSVAEYAGKGRSGDGRARRAPRPTHER
jgi:Ca-activated chloride channel family protein